MDACRLLPRADRIPRFVVPQRRIADLVPSLCTEVSYRRVSLTPVEDVQVNLSISARRRAVVAWFGGHSLTEAPLVHAHSPPLTVQA